MKNIGIKFFQEGLRLLLLTCLSSLGVVCTLEAQISPKFEVYDIDKGLSHASVTAILKDRYGFMWIGTRDGLNRYDSYDFQVFRSDPEDSTSLSNNTINCLFEDSKGLIWVGTEGGGLNTYDPATNQFTRYMEAGEGTLPDNSVYTIIEDRAGNYWVGSSTGLSKLQPESGTFEYHFFPAKAGQKAGENMVMDIFEDPEQPILWLATEGAGLVKYHPGSGEFIHFMHNPEDDNSLAGDIVNSITQDINGLLWIGSWGWGLHSFDPSTHQFTRFHKKLDPPYQLPDNNVFAVTQDSQGIIWAATRNGLVTYDGAANKTELYQAESGNPHSLSDNVPFSIYYDQDQDILWVGTWGAGLNKLDRYGRQVRHFRNNPDHANSLSFNDVFALYEDARGVLWIGTEGGGLNRYDPNTHSFKHYRHDPNNASSISSDEVMCIYRSKQGDFWIGTFGGGLNRFNEETGTFSLYEGTPDRPFLNRTILSIVEDNQQHLWLTTTQEGVIRLDPETNTYTYYGDPDDSNSRLSSDIMSIVQDTEGYMWFASRNSGLSRLDPRTGDFQYFKNEPDNVNSLSANGVYALHLDQENNLWIGTRGGGINILSLPLSEEPIFEKLSSTDGLFGDWILGIEEDAYGNIWVSGDGLSRVAKDDRTITSYDFSGSNQGAFHKGSYSGKFFMGTVGVDIFHPDSIFFETPRPQLLISDLHRFNQKDESGRAIAVPGIYARDTIVLSYNDRMLNFEFLNLSYDHVGDRQYAFLMDPFNEDWIQLGTERKTTFTGLPPGTYTLKVGALSATGQLEAAQNQLVIKILPPWWNAFWAKILYSIIAVGLLYGLFIWRTREHKNRIALQEEELKKEREINDRLQQVDRLKDQFLANTSHELRTPLQGIIGLSESLVEKVHESAHQDDLGLIISSGKRLNSLVNDILDFSKLRNNELTLHTKATDVRSAANIVITLSQPLVRNKDLVLANAIEDGIPLVDADENRVQQILHNLIGNAIKFSKAGTIEVTAKMQGELLAISVSDEGIGIAPERQSEIFHSFQQLEESLTREHGGTGLGLTVSKQLVELHGGTMSIASQLGKGSTFTFTLPISSTTVSLEPMETVVNEYSKAEEGRIYEQPKAISGDFHILVADDEPVNLKVLDNHLTQAGYRVSYALDGEEALTLINSGPKFDLMILDVMMPKLSGFEVCKEIRKTLASNQLPIIMLTAKDTMADLVQGFNLGANDYLTKPFSKDELLSRIKTHLNLHRINRATAKFVPNEFLEALGRESITEVKLGDHSKKNFTVFFSDIRGYTTLAEDMTPEENFNFINAYVGRMGPIIKKNMGFVNQYLGDGIMAIFPDTFQEAMVASIDMQKAINNYNEHRLKNGRLPIKVGMGLHLGDLVMGIIGDEQRIEPSLISDTVNVASRMEGLTKYYGANIVLSEACLLALEDSQNFNFRYLGLVQVKGKEQSIKAFECIDGDETETRDGKIKTLDLYNEGLELFYAREFAQATAIFAQILKANPQDQVAQYFQDLAAKYTHEGVTDDWTGIERMAQS